MLPPQTWTWSCIGSGGGTNSSCSATNAPLVVQKFGVSPFFRSHAHNSSNRMNDNWVQTFSLSINATTGTFNATNSYTYVFRLAGDRGIYPFVQYTATINPSNGNISIGVDDGIGGAIVRGCAVTGPRETATFSGRGQIYNSGLYYINN